LCQHHDRRHALPVSQTAGPAPAAPAAARLDVEIVETGLSTYSLPFSGAPTVSAAVVVRNPNPTTWTAAGIDLTITFRDAAGTVVGTNDRGRIEAIPPGATRAFAVSGQLSSPGLNATPTRMDVAITGDIRWLRPEQLAAGTITTGRATARALKPDGVYPVTRLEVTCDATSTLPVTPQQFSLVVLYRDAKGALTGGDTAFGSIDKAPLTVAPNSATRLDLVLAQPPLTVPRTVECAPNHDVPEV
jgi:hypothetical protein